MRMCARICMCICACIRAFALVYVHRFGVHVREFARVCVHLRVLASV